MEDASEVAGLHSPLQIDAQLIADEQPPFFSPRGPESGEGDDNSNSLVNYHHISASQFFTLEASRAFQRAPSNQVSNVYLPFPLITTCGVRFVFCLESLRSFWGWERQQIR